MKKKAAPVLVVLLLIVVIAAAGLITHYIDQRTPTDTHMDLQEYYGTGDGETAIMVNGQICESRAATIEGSLYIDYNTVNDFINKRFYWDTEEDLMVYATPTEVHKIDLSQGTTDYIKQDDTLYLSVDALASYTDMECQVYEDPARVVIWNDWDQTNVTTVQSDTAVRYRGGIKSPILKDVSTGTTLRVLDDSLENWIGVTTEDGLTGYVERTATSAVEASTQGHESQQEAYTSQTRDFKINMVWHQTTSQAANAEISNMMAEVTGVNVVAPTWFFINDIEGNVTSLASHDYVTYIHDNNMEVWAVLNDFDGNISTNDETYEALKATSQREKIINTVMDAVSEYDLDGINVDIEKVSEQGADAYLEFLRELSVACRNAGIVLSVDNYVPQDYSAYYDREEQGIIADYVIMMGYDEHYSGSEEPGSVASLPYVEDGIRRMLEMVPKEKVINAIPFYTRLWTRDSSGNLESATYGMNGADEQVAELGMEKSWDESTGQNYAELYTADTTYQIWLEDEQSVEEKMKMIQDYDLAGVAEWKLGFERPAVWAIISEYLGN